MRAFSRGFSPFTTFASEAKRMRPVGLLTAVMISSQASMQAVQFTHSNCVPLRMSIPVGQTRTQAAQSTQSPCVCSVFRAFPRGSPRT